MKLNWNTNGSNWQHCAPLLLAVALALTGMTQSASAQEAGDQKPCPAKAPPPAESNLTVYLANMTQPQDANDLQTAVRNIVSHIRVYYDQTANAILLRGTADDLAQAQKIIADLDRPKKAYRVEYTIKSIDGAKPTAAQHYALIAVLGERAQLKLGNRVPLVTGKTDADSGNPSSQVQYIDVGLTITATLTGRGDGLFLRTKVEQSSLAEEKSGIGLQDPLLRQEVLENASTIALGKILTLGSLDVPGGTNRLEVEVLSEAAK
jgi:type II secretory pathway component GspD/PulD (secretin)